MSKLVWTDLSYDGVRDISGDSGAVSTSGYAQERPRTNGSITTSSTSTTATTVMRDWANSAVVDTSTATWTSTVPQLKGSVSISNYFYGWGTAGGIQSISQSLSSSQTGTIMTGDTNYTTSAWPLSSSTNQPSGSNWDGNKWLSCAGVHFADSAVDTYYFKLAFEGGGAQTTDTDWDSVYVKWHGDTGLKFTRGSNDNGVYSVVSYNSRIVYSWFTVASTYPNADFTLSFE